MRVLVTGLGGFTGGYLKKELENHQHQVTGLEADLLDKEALAAEIAMKNPEAVIHLAALTFVHHNNVEDFYKVNLLGSENLLQNLSRYTSNLQSVMVVSTASVYGNTDKPLLDENTIPAPVNDYAASKLAMEEMAKKFENLPLFIVRPFNYTGVGQALKFLIPKIVYHFQNKSPLIEMGNLDVAREFNDVRFVSAVYRKLLEKNPVGKIINVCTNNSWTLQEVLSLAEQLTTHSPQIVINKNFVRDNEIRLLRGSSALLQSIIGKVREIPFKDTLSWMLNLPVNK